MKRVRVRYAPSPTGHLHIGNARTALFNYLFAKHYQGDFILRIEDTDIERNVAGGEESQLYYLNWLGIDPDESPVKPNPKYAPYRQMERLDYYKQIADQLLKQKDAYKCFCTPEELEEDYNRQKAAGYASTRYSGKCRHLTPEQVASKEAAGLSYVIRVKVPEDTSYIFSDLIRGEVQFESKDIGDWVLVKSNGIPTYNFAVVVDDHYMDISHVFRGEEHLSNTPKQLMLYQMLNWDAPIFAHMTLIVNEQHRKLSKRDNTIMQFMSQYKEKGYLPEAMFNFMALLGWSPEGEQEIFTPLELVEIFDEKRLSKSPSMFDKNKLTWINNRYLKNLPLEELYDLTLPFLHAAYPDSNLDINWQKDLINLYQDQLSYGAEIVELSELFFKDFSVTDDALEIYQADSTKIVKAEFLNQIKTHEKWTRENLKSALENTKNNTTIKGKPLFMGLRVAITGQLHGPDLINTIYLIGKDAVSDRLSR